MELNLKLPNGTVSAYVYYRALYTQRLPDRHMTGDEAAAFASGWDAAIKFMQQLIKDNA